MFPQGEVHSLTCGLYEYIHHMAEESLPRSLKLRIGGCEAGTVSQITQAVSSA